MKTLDQIKNEVAKESGYNDWEHLMIESDPGDFVDEVAIAYGKEIANRFETYFIFK